MNFNWVALDISKRDKGSEEKLSLLLGIDVSWKPSPNSAVSFQQWLIDKLQLLGSPTKFLLPRFTWEHITGEGNTLGAQNKESQTHWYNTEPLAMVWVKMVTGPKMPAWLCNWRAVILHLSFKKSLQFLKIWQNSMGSGHNFCCCSVAWSRLTLCDHLDCCTPVFPVLHHLPEFAQTYVHWVSGAIQPSHPLSFPLPPASFKNFK